MKNEETILSRYVKLSHAVTEADKTGTTDEQLAAGDKFWAFVDKYMYSISIAEIRRVDVENELEFTAFT